MEYDEAKKCLNDAKAKELIRHPNLLKYVNSFMDQQYELCSNTYKIYVVYQYEHYTLEKEINERKKGNQVFVENEIISILYGLVGALSVLEKNQITHQDISLSNIYMDQYRCIKIADPCVIHEPNLYTQILLKNKKTNNLYLSPKQVEGLQNNQTNPQHDSYKSDVYTLGMCILHISLFESCDSVYNYNRGYINQNILEQKLLYLRTKYSQKLCFIIKNMLLFDENERFDFKMIHQCLIRDYENDIFQQQIKDYVDYDIDGEEKIKRHAQKNKDYQKVYKTQDQRNNNDNSAISMQFCCGGIQPPTLAMSMQQYSHSVIQPPTPQSKELIISQYKLQNQVTFKKERDDQGSELNIFQSLKIHIKQDDLGDHELEGNHQVIYASEEIVGNYTNGQIQMPKSRVYEVAGVRYEVMGDKKAPKVINYSIAFQNMRNTNNQMDSSQHYTEIKQYRQTLNQNSNSISITQDWQNQNFQNQEFGKFSANQYNSDLKKPVIQSANNRHLLKNSQMFDIKESYEDQDNYIGNNDYKEVTETYKNGDQYKGEKLNGQRHGKGKMIFKEENYYDGQWKFNKMTGIGTLYKNEETILYHGHWLDDNLDGEGQLVNQYYEPMNEEYLDPNNFDPYIEGNNWVEYTGNFRTNAKHGYGIMNFYNGDLYQGMFKDDIIHGKGIFIKKNGEKLNGIWNNNRLV